MFSIEHFIYFCTIFNLGFYVSKNKKLRYVNFISKDIKLFHIYVEKIS